MNFLILIVVLSAILLKGWAVALQALLSQLSPQDEFISKIS
jgi:hypothetical protein